MNKTILFCFVIFGLSNLVASMPSLFILLEKDGSGSSDVLKWISFGTSLLNLLIPLIVFAWQFRKAKPTEGSVCTIQEITALVSSVGIVIGCVLILSQLPIIFAISEYKSLNLRSVIELIQPIILIILSFNLSKLVRYNLGKWSNESLHRTIN